MTVKQLQSYQKDNIYIIFFCPKILVKRFSLIFYGEPLYMDGNMLIFIVDVITRAQLLHYFMLKVQTVSAVATHQYHGIHQVVTVVTLKQCYFHQTSNNTTRSKSLRGLFGVIVIMDLHLEIMKIYQHIVNPSIVEPILNHMGKSKPTWQELMAMVTRSSLVTKTTLHLSILSATKQPLFILDERHYKSALFTLIIYLFIFI